MVNHADDRMYKEQYHHPHRARQYGRQMDVVCLSQAHHKAHTQVEVG